MQSVLKPFDQGFEVVHPMLKTCDSVLFVWSGLGTPILRIGLPALDDPGE